MAAAAATHHLCAPRRSCLMRQPGEKRGVTVQDRPLKGAWGMTALIFLFMLINFADKIVVGLAAKPIMEELKLSPEDFGQLVGSSFFFLSAVSAVVVGFVANRFQTRHALLVMALVWALAQFPMLVSASLWVLVACRVVFGLADGPSSPIATDAIYKWFPDAQRGIPTAIIAQGSAFGVILAVPALNWLIVERSWHWAFGALGLVGLAWVVLWLMFGREGTLVDPPVGEHSAAIERIPYRYLIFCPSIVAVCCAAFAVYWGLALGLTWFTAYLIDGLGFSQTMAGDLSILPWIFGMVAVLLGGLISQHMQSRGVSTRICRGVFAAGTVTLGGCLVPFVFAMPTPGLKLALLVAGTSVGATIFVVLPMIVCELTPQPQRAAMLAITNSAVGLAGVLAPLVMGRLVEATPSPALGYEEGFVVLGLLLVAGGVVGMLFIRPEIDRKALARHALPAPSMQPARG
jgi:predicted MFS family arabinose efflux permease